MSQYLGLDPTAVRQLAKSLDNFAAEIRQLTGQLTGQLSNTPWTGPDREQFLQDWQGTHATHLQQVANALEAASQTAMRNAMDQESVSGA
jgi:uncharacterized protein YukE